LIEFLNPLHFLAAVGQNGKSDRHHIGRDKFMAFVCENDLKNLLRDVFGYAGFRSGQLEIIIEILAQRSVFAVMPPYSLAYPLAGQE
jgi:superfamily II DNA helicase RecQ